MSTCILDKQGRITLPSSFRESQGLEPGRELVAFEEEGRLLVMTREQAIREAQEMVRKLVPPGASLVDEFLAERRKEAEQEWAKETKFANDSKRLGKKNGRLPR